MYEIAKIPFTYIYLVEIESIEINARMKYAYDAKACAQKETETRIIRNTYARHDSLPITTSKCNSYIYCNIVVRNM